MSEFDYYLAFSYAPGIGPKRFLNLLHFFETAKKAWSADAHELEKAGLSEKVRNNFIVFRNSFDFDSIQKDLMYNGIVFIPQSAKKYPPSLLELPNPPIGLFTKGNANLLQAENVLAVVGSRKTTQYGREITNTLVNEISLKGLTVISGLALGVDAIAHASCLHSEGTTIAVLGCGVDCCYPQENYPLYKKILTSGGLILSEYPPSTPPSKGSFLARNRIIAALSKGILITEATEDSGSLITAEWGKKLLKKVFAVPGPITSGNSYGTLGLIQNGAVLVRNSKDIIDAYPAINMRFGKSLVQKNTVMNKSEEKIYDLLTEEMDIDELARMLHISIIDLNSQLSEMELKGMIKIENGKIRATA